MIAALPSRSGPIGPSDHLGQGLVRHDRAQV